MKNNSVNNETKEEFVKLLLIGDSKVGKSSIISTYINGKFPTHHIITNG